VLRRLTFPTVRGDIRRGKSREEINTRKSRRAAAKTIGKKARGLAGPGHGYPSKRGDYPDPGLEKMEPDTRRRIHRSIKKKDRRTHQKGRERSETLEQWVTSIYEVKTSGVDIDHYQKLAYAKEKKKPQEGKAYWGRSRGESDYFRGEGD